MSCVCADSKATVRETYIAFFNPLLGPAPGHDATTRNQVGRQRCSRVRRTCRVR